MAEPGGSDIAENSSPDTFTATLAMMEENGTDAQTQAVYRNILQTIANNRGQFDNSPHDGIQTLDHANPMTAAMFGQWLETRVEIPGMPIITADNPDAPKFKLGPNYHNGEEWITTVCIDDPRILNARGRIDSRKPDGSWNMMYGVVIDPGDKNTPGDMYGTIPGQDPIKLSPGLRDRIENAFLLSAVDANRVRNPLLHDLGLPAEVSEALISDYKHINGEPIQGGQIKQLQVSDIYKLALGGEIVNSTGNIPNSQPAIPPVA